MKLRALALLVAASLAAAPALAQNDPYASIHSVQIVSLLGDGLVLRNPGGIFDSGDPDIVVDTGAHLDDLVSAQVREALAGRFTIVDGPINPALLKGYPLPPGLADRPSDARAADALIVVQRTSVEEEFDQPYYTAHIVLQGFTLTHSSGGLFVRTSGYLSTQYEVVVIDANTGQVIRSGVAHMDPRALLFGNRPYPQEQCDEGFWPQSPQHLTDAERTRLAIELSALIAETLPNALYYAGLVHQGSDTMPDIWDGHKLVCR
ncbi:MAG TPA: hypothetical protein VMJ73_15355 [Rhizomicrobium sp.]|nr:hypothetical protein [Rhizomicrobium sp.]